MNRGWLETIRLLGLDLELGIVLALMLSSALTALARRFAGSVRRSMSPLECAVARRREAARADADTWTAKDLRPSH